MNRQREITAEPKYHDVRFDYGDNFLEVGVNKYSNGNIQGFQSVGRRKHNGVK